MQKINLRELYPDIYKTDTYLEVTDEVQAVFLADKRAEARYLRQMYNYKAHYSLDCDNGIEKSIVQPPPTPEETELKSPLCSPRRPRKKSWRTSSSAISSTLR